MENSKIEWTDHTFNPWEGCTKVSPGCDHCYAETRNARFGGGQAVNWGANAPRRRTSTANWNKPVKWNAEYDLLKSAWDKFKATNPSLTDEAIIARGFTKPERPRVFCASLADVFDNEVPDQWRADLLDLIKRTPNLDWLVLTKRIGNVQRMLADIDVERLPSNVWLGATIVNQQEADRDIPKLLTVDASVRFLSMEPLLSPVDIRAHIAPRDLPFLTIGSPLCIELPSSVGCARKGPHYPYEFGCRWSKIDNGGSLPGIDWVIVGGESGTHARPMHPAWAQSLRDQCEAGGTPFLFKQWGEWQPISQQTEAFTNSLYKSNKKAAPHENQDAIDELYGRHCTAEKTVMHLDGSVHDPMEPNAFLPGAMTMYRVGKKAAGRMLDGKTYDGYPKGHHD